jgi:hypothetical protein
MVLDVLLLFISDHPLSQYSCVWYGPRTHNVILGIQDEERLKMTLRGSKS